MSLEPNAKKNDSRSKSQKVATARVLILFQYFGVRI